MTANNEKIRAFVKIGIVVYLAIMLSWFVEGSLFDFTNALIGHFGLHPKQILVFGELLCVLGVIQFFGIIFTLLCALCAWIYYVRLRNKA